MKRSTAQFSVVDSPSDFVPADEWATADAVTQVAQGQGSQTFPSALSRLHRSTEFDCPAA